MAPPEFNPNSYDAQFATILNMLKDQKEVAEATRQEMKEGFVGVGNRLHIIEEWKSYLMGKVAGVALVVSVIGTVIGWFLAK